MKITAKFNSKCPVCKGRITRGTRVEWTKGSKARHLDCANTYEPRHNDAEYYENIPEPTQADLDRAYCEAQAEAENHIYMDDQGYGDPYYE
jgi:hypothetical protein